MCGWNGRKYVQGCMPVYIQEKTALCTMVRRQTDSEEDGGLYSFECLLGFNMMHDSGPLVTKSNGIYGEL